MEKKKQKQVSFRLDESLFNQAKEKCRYQFGVPLTTLFKIFLVAFVSRGGIGFYFGDDQLGRMVNTWINKRQHERKFRTKLPGPRLKDIYNFNKSNK